MTVSNLADAQRNSDEIVHSIAHKNGFHQRAKRVVDIVVCIAAAPAALIVVGVAALIAIATMGRPIFYSQDRVGLNGRKFKMHKLRSMRQANERSSATRATIVGDPRITPFGAFLRRSHIDEVPQLWNVMRGEMTLIGPRPEQPHLVEHYRSVLRDYDRRHLVKPGLSGWAQVRYGYAADVSETSHKLRFDLHYIENFGPLIDLKIAALTLAIFMNKRFVR